MTRPSDSSPFLEFNRAQWGELRQNMPQVLTEAEVIALRGVGENIDLAEANDVYLPLSRLIHLQVKARQKLHNATATFLGEEPGKQRIPFIIGISGSVAVGKSTTSRLLQLMLARWPSHPRVELVTTDGFLYPTAELTRRGILSRKGFPESYDRRALLSFINAVKSGHPEVHAPIYSHVTYDRVPDETQVIARPDILIVEGLNVLQTGPTLMVSDFFDFSIYVDAKITDIESWYIDRFLTLRHTAFSREDSYFRHYADLSDEEAVATARRIWAQVNYPNLVQNIRPTRVRADLVLWKAANHSINRIRMRKI